MATMMQREQTLDYWEGGRYFEGWYVVCMSDELKPGSVVGRDLLGTRVVAYRDEAGAPVVQGAYCPHLGADLSGGEMTPQGIRCPYHFWKFAADGRCVDIPSGDAIPGVARLQNYPVAEAWGLVWIFHGDREPLPVPSPFGVIEADSVFRTFSRPEQDVESWIPTSNSVDFQHLKTVHKMPDIFLPKEVEIGDGTLSYDTNGPNGVVRSVVFGCNTFALRSQQHDQPAFVVFSQTAVRPGVCSPYYACGFRKQDLEGLSEAEIDERLTELATWVYNLYPEDAEILDTIRFRPLGRAALVRSDRHLTSFLRYIDDLPRTLPRDC